MAEPTWIVLADEGRMCIYARPRPEADVEPIEEFVDEDARARNAEFRRDAYGRRDPAGGGMTGDNMASAGEQKLDHEAEQFARRVADHLARSVRERRCSELRIAAAPRFLGRLRKRLDPQVREVVTEEIDRDLLQLDRRALTLRFFPPRSQNEA